MNKIFADRELSRNNNARIFYKKLKFENEVLRGDVRKTFVQCCIHELKDSLDFTFLKMFERRMLF